MKFLDKVLNLIYPENYTCIVCDDDVFDGDEKCLCEECKNAITRILDRNLEELGKYNQNKVNKLFSSDFVNQYMYELYRNI